MHTRAHIIVSGHVHGVGYRYFVRQAAAALHLTGWVRNLPGREVEIVAEGPRGMIQELIDELPVGNSMASVRAVTTRWEAYTGEFSGFTITF
ncbi:acylphosphatase [bacterium]|nr:acylphosphatase [bacterium]